jgi:T4-like virus tail tube protein gp19
MPKPSLSSVAASIVDPMLSDNYELRFPNIPTGDNIVPFIMQCRTASKPGITINPVEVQLFGHTLEFAGNLTYSHDMAVEYLENRKAEITSTLERWAEMIRSHESQHGAYKNEYSRDAYLYIYDQKGIIVKEYVIVNCWPSQVPETAFDGQSSNAIALQVTFKYDYYYART